MTKITTLINLRHLFRRHMGRHHQPNTEYMFRINWKLWCLELPELICIIYNSLQSQITNIRFIIPLVCSSFFTAALFYDILIM